MNFTLLDEEWTLVATTPLDDLVALAADLDLVVPAEVDRRQIIEACIPLIVNRAQGEGLPLSKYDREDVEALSPHLRQALGRLQGVRGKATVRSILRAGARVYGQYSKRRPNDTLPLLMPLLLVPVTRYAATQFNE